MTINKLGRITAITILASLAAVAQDNPRFEVGIRGGGGSYGAFDDSRSNPLASIGVEACAFCNGHAGLFAEYSHWLPTATVPSSAVNSADLFGFGLRLQGKRRVRPFFDIGIAVGRDTFYRSGGGILTAHSTAGAVFGAGVMFPLGKRLYLRPQFHVYPMSSMHIAASGALGLGWRF